MAGGLQDHPKPPRDPKQEHFGTRRVARDDRMVIVTGPERTLVEGFRHLDRVGDLEELVMSASGSAVLDFWTCWTPSCGSMTYAICGLPAAGSSSNSSRRFRYPGSISRDWSGGGRRRSTSTSKTIPRRM